MTNDNCRTCSNHLDPSPLYLTTNWFLELASYNSSNVVSNTLCPFFIKQKRSHISLASFKIWVEKIIAVSFFISFKIAITYLLPIGSNAETGSSITRKLGLCKIACAIPKRCFIPPEN